MLLSQEVIEMVANGLEAARIERLANIDPMNDERDDELSLLDAPSPGLTELLTSGRLSDFTIHCGDKAFKVHRMQIYSRSDYFKFIIDGEFQESLENAVTLEETNPPAVAMLLLIMYAGKSGLFLDKVYKVWQDLRPGTTNTVSHTIENITEEHFATELRTLVDVYVLSDRLMVDHVQAPLAQHILRLIDYDYFTKRQDTAPRLTVYTAPLLDYIYAHTTADDTLLRQQLTVMCMRNRHRLSDSLSKVIESHEQYAWTLGIQVCSQVKKSHDAVVINDFSRIIGGKNAEYTRSQLRSLLRESLWKPFGLV
jgi:hypothetical protein